MVKPVVKRSPIPDTCGELTRFVANDSNATANESPFKLRAVSVGFELN
jgi:hypothetical protein